MKGLIIGYVAVVLFVLGCWVVNINKLYNCDFESNYKCEFVHAVGLIPPASVITIWFDTDKDN